MLVGNTPGLGRRARRDRGIPRGRGSQLHRHVRRRNALPLATSQDHKRLLDGDRGPNTGGMGAYSPAPVVTPEIHARVMREVIQPTLAGMAQDGLPVHRLPVCRPDDHPTGSIKVLEFNCRMGDPETQPIMMRLKTDLVDLIEPALVPARRRAQADWDRRVALGVVMAAAGYPDASAQGRRDHGTAGAPLTKSRVPRRHDAAGHDVVTATAAACCA
jgi:phosphoribosylamine--glycine ligase